MSLPELPRQLKKVEAEWTTTYLRGWLEKNYGTCAWEAKHTRGKDYLNFNEVKPHQIDNLLKVRHGTFVYKVVDMGEKTPFDGFCMKEERAVVVIKYPRFFCLIDIDTFLLEKQRSKRKSLTSKRACEISLKVVHS